MRQTAADTDGELLAIDLELPADRRVPGGLHVHPLQEERFEVRGGHHALPARPGHRRGRPGEVVVGPAGVRRDFANVGEEDALVGVEVRPALRMEEMFVTAVALAQNGRTMWGGIQRPLELALLQRAMLAPLG